MEKSMCPAKWGTLCPIWYLLSVDQICSEQCTSCGSDPGSLGLEVSDKCLGADQHWKHVYRTHREVCSTRATITSEEELNSSKSPLFVGDRIHFTNVLLMDWACRVFPCTFTLQVSRWEVRHLCILCKPWKQARKWVKLGKFCQIKAQAWAPCSLDSNVINLHDFMPTCRI